MRSVCGVDTSNSQATSLRMDNAFSNNGNRCLGGWLYCQKISLWPSRFGYFGGQLRGYIMWVVVSSRKAHQMNEKATNTIGLISLSLALTAIVAPILLYLCLTMSVRPIGSAHFGLPILLFFVIDLPAFVTGIIGRKSAFGKAGLAMSAISFAIVVSSWLYLFSKVIIVP